MLLGTLRQVMKDDPDRDAVARLASHIFFEEGVLPQLFHSFDSLMTGLALEDGLKDRIMTIGRFPAVEVEWPDDEPSLVDLADALSTVRLAA